MRDASGVCPQCRFSTAKRDVMWCPRCDDATLTWDEVRDEAHEAQDQAHEVERIVVERDDVSTDGETEVPPRRSTAPEGTVVVRPPVDLTTSSTPSDSSEAEYVDASESEAYSQTELALRRALMTVGVVVVVAIAAAIGWGVLP